MEGFYKMLVVECKERLSEVREKAQEMGILDRLEERLEYLASYGGGDSDYVCRLYHDFADLSFGFSLFRKVSGEERHVMSGGLIYFSSDQTWSTHT